MRDLQDGGEAPESRAHAVPDGDAASPTGISSDTGGAPRLRQWRWRQGLGNLDPLEHDHQG